MSGNDDFPNFVTHQDVIDLDGLSSHQQRAVFLEQCYEKKLSSETIFAIYVLATVTRNRDELLKRFPALPSSFRNRHPFVAAYEFIKNHMVGWAYEVQPGVNFSLVNVLITNPSICLLIWKMIVPPEKRTIDDVLKTSFSTQLDLDSELRAIHYEHQKNFWNEAIPRMNRLILEAKSKAASEARMASKEDQEAETGSN